MICVLFIITICSYSWTSAGGLSSGCMPNGTIVPENRCGSPQLSVEKFPDGYFYQISKVIPQSVVCVNPDCTEFEIPGRPLLGVLRLNDELTGIENGGGVEIVTTMDFEETCNLANLKEEVQTALELEWATIPAYLTAYFTAGKTNLFDTTNSYIRKSFEHVWRQEMTHMQIAANLLVAMGGKPEIDSAKAAPKYPACGLPGGVLPGLHVQLKKMSRDQIHDVFMPIEVPVSTHVAGDISSDILTIGTFYNKIKDCLDALENRGEDIFENPSIDKQVKLLTDGESVIIRDTNSAKAAIDIIVAQGEGSGVQNPYGTSGSSLAHFFRFEEIYCGKRLKSVGDDHYAYNGSHIELNSAHIKPIHANFNSSLISKDSECYAPAKAFHNQYRKLLSQMQLAYTSGPPYWRMVEAITSMIFLKYKAQVLISKPYDEDSNCGLVWDYNWQGPQ